RGGIKPRERLAHMIENFYGLSRLGPTDAQGMPHLLQLALCARGFNDVIVFPSPPLAGPHPLFVALPPPAPLRPLPAAGPPALPDSAGAETVVVSVAWG